MGVLSLLGARGRELRANRCFFQREAEAQAVLQLKLSAKGPRIVKDLIVGRARWYHDHQLAAFDLRAAFGAQDLAGRAVDDDDLDVVLAAGGKGHRRNRRNRRNTRDRRKPAETAHAGAAGGADDFPRRPINDDHFHLGFHGDAPAQGFASGLASGSNPGSAIGGANFSDSLAAADGGSDGGGLLSGGAGGSGGSSGSGSSGGSWSLGDIDLGDDAGAFIIVVIAVIVVAAAVFGIVFYAVYSAPTFFAELLIDGGVGTWLYKRANVKDEPDWLGTAVRRTLWPVAAALALFWAFGGLIEFMAPGATTVGQALQITQNPR